MALSDKDKERINLMNPVSNDLKLGDKLAELDKIDDLFQRVQELEDARGGD